MALFLSLWIPNAKSLPFSPQIYRPLRRQTQSGILLRNYSSIICPTKPGKNPFTYRNGEIQHTLSTKLSPIVRAAAMSGSDNDGEDMSAAARISKFLEMAPGSPAGARGAVGVDAFAVPVCPILFQLGCRRRCGGVGRRHGRVGNYSLLS
nr:palmitoyl-monogalactosyldiacylglycerol delta-7 desaturase, chloroplastic-like [Ipomoea trifida]